MMRKGLLILLLSSLCSLLAAAPHFSESTLQALANQPYWLLLGHYQRESAGWHSQATGASFFLATNGEQDPYAELQATLTGFYLPPSLADEHPQCRYPARLYWLRERLTLSDLPSVPCAKYQTWYRGIDPVSATLVFPAAFLNSPSSIFGHTLLRVDSPALHESGSALLSHSLSFGATIDEADNSLLYAWKGLMGGYLGRFVIQPYYEKIAEYSRLENRDLWEYPLNLTPTETARAVAHIWELQAVTFDYFFFDKNCSYRLLELLAVARPGLSLTEPFSLTAIPTDTIRAVREAGLMTGATYRPSRERELMSRVASLTLAEQRWVERLAEQTQARDEPAFQALSAERQALILDGAYRLVRYQAASQERNPATAQRSFALLQAIHANPPPALAIQPPHRPEDGHRSRTLEVALGSRDKQAYAQYGLRMAYHDLQDNLKGFPLGAQIEIASVKVRQYANHHWQLQNLDVVSIRSFAPRSGVLKPWSWQINGGLQQVLGRGHHETLVAQVNGGMGFSQRWRPELMGFAMLTARLEHNGRFAQWLSPAMGVDTGLLWRNPLGNLLLEADADYFANGEIRRRISLSQQWEVANELGLRLTAKRQYSKRAEPMSEVQLALRWYFF